MDPELQLPDLFTTRLESLRSQTEPITKPLVDAAQANYASAFYKRLVEWINKFDETLDQTQEVGVRLVNFGQTVVFRLIDMGYYNPSLISFVGVLDDGKPVELIQHVSQISVLLMALPREDLTKPKRRMGFSEPNSSSS